ncbi:MAG: YitT family protein [Erysipelotrichaceae bacterium]|nr:YitT family protein [Erysipelotrichaceae bacterium]
MNKTANFIKEYFMITLGSFIVACSVFFFLVPSHLTIASISGLAIIISNFVNLPVSWITLILNIICLVLGYFLIGKEFGGKTAYSSIVFPLFMAMFEQLLPNYTSVLGDPALDMVCYLFVVSLGQSILFKVNASSGGIDILGKILNKYTYMDLGKSISSIGLVIAVSSVFLYDAKTAILSVLGSYLNGIVLDYFLYQSINIKRVSIVSPKYEEIRKYIVDEIVSGATLYEGIGAYSLEKKMEIVTLVDKREYALLMDFVKKTDPKAFVTVYNCKEIMYNPKKK